MDKTYCIFGDSVTQAAYVKTSWVDLFRQFLEQKYPNDSIDVFNLGISGNTTSDILNRFENESLARNPTSIIFQIGVNDSGYLKTPDNPITEENQFRTNIEEIIIRANKFSKDKTFIGLTIGDDSILKPFPGSSTGKSYDKSRVKTYDKILKEIAEQKGYKYIEMLKYLKPEDFMDGLHPNEEGHRKIYEVIKRYF